MHELVHLEFNINAQLANANKKFVTTKTHEQNFLKSLDDSKKELLQKGISEANINRYLTSIFEGINSQVFNAPIDLFIEDYLYNEFATIRPFQFLSLFSIIEEGIASVADKRAIDLVPKNILSTSKIYNMVQAKQFKDLYGVDLLFRYAATKEELKIANEFYNEFLEYKNDKKPGEEYELVEHWAEDLRLDNYFELIDESKFFKGEDDIDSFLKSIEEDPYGFNVDVEKKKKETETFQNAQAEIGTNMAVVMFMVDAMQYFKDKSEEEIKKIAIEIALLGTQGFNPEQKGYRVNSIKGKEFSGNHILAYYYVSFQIAIPEMLSQLGLPFDEEFKLAQLLSQK